ncbi:MAG: glycine-rich protein [Bacteroidetes bacterium]|nr:glycine-rich protein [Bacteroidota bacterium]
MKILKYTIILILSLSVEMVDAQIISDPGNMTTYRGNNYVTYSIRIDLACAPAGSAWGGCSSTPFTDDSNIKSAARHAFGLSYGRIYIVYIEIRPGLGSYTGCMQNGITSQNYTTWPGSYVITGYYDEASSSVPATPDTPTSNSPGCANVTITRTGTSPSGETWYWETSATGTGTDNAADINVVSTSGTYYIRSFRTCDATWSNAASLSVTVDPGTAPTAPGTGIFSGNSANLSASGGTGNYRWYDAPTGGNLMQTGASYSTPILNQTASYYAEAYAQTLTPSATTYTFTNCGVYGRLGPNQTQANSAYNGTSLQGSVTIYGSGLQKWVVPATGTYTIDAYGAQGGTVTSNLSGTDYNYAYLGLHVSGSHHAGGKGARIKGDFDLATGDVLYIMAGQMGMSKNRSDYGGGGGGATYVTKEVTSSSYYLPSLSKYISPLVTAAGGGGGGDDAMPVPSGGGRATLTGSTTGGTAVSAGGGGGLSGDGAALGGISFVNGGAGYNATYGGGGFGGGGGAYDGGGGGGGHQGGAGINTRGGLGGLSFNDGSNQTNTSDSRVGHGYVVITKKEPAVYCISSRTGVQVTVNNDFSWNGGSTDWNTPGNWNSNTIPNSYVNVTIPITGNDPVISSNTECNNLAIQSGAALTLAPARKFTVNGTFTNNGSFTIRSDATGTGSLIHHTAGVKATAQRYIDGWTDASHGWHFMSSPVASQAISSTFADITANPMSSAVDLYKWSEPDNLWINIKNSSNTYNQGSSTTNWSNSSNPAFETGKGYLITYSTSQTKEFTGILNISDVELAGLTNTAGKTNRGWHLVGNPFSSAIKWTQGTWVKTNIAAIPQIWDESNASYKVLQGEGIIPAQNGFMVYVPEGQTGALTIPADARLHSDSAWYKNSASGNEIVLVARDPDGLTAQESTLAFNPEATEGFDSDLDSYFMAGFAPMFYSISQNGRFALNTLPQLTDELVVPMGFVKNQNSRFIIETIRNIPFQTLYLVDLKTNHEQKISESPYIFTSDDGDNPNRFLLRFGHVGISDLKVKQPINAWYHAGTLTVTNCEGPTAIDIINIHGQNLQNYQIGSGGPRRIPLLLPAGLYFARIANAGKMRTIKLVVH